jgi:hypothetical protein
MSVRPEQLVNTMSCDVQAARKVLFDLKKAYQSLPRDIRGRVVLSLLESATPAELCAIELKGCTGDGRSLHVKGVP